MNRVKVLLVALCTLLLVNTSNAQIKKGIDYSGFFDTYYYPNIWEFSAGIGYPLYYGDLCGSAIGCNSGNLSYVVGAALKPWPKVAFEADFYYTTLSGDDLNPERNISFTSRNFELALYGKYFFRDDVIRRHSDMFKPTKVFKPYGLIGVGGLVFNPKATQTDSSGVTSDVVQATYPGLSMTIPAGIGAEFAITRRVAIVAEIIYRYTFTDRLDGVSEKPFGNPDVKDSYLTIDLKVQWSPWAPRKKKKKLKDLKEVPQYNFAAADSAKKAKAAGGTDSTGTKLEKNDEEMDYYEQLLKEAEEENSGPEEEYYDPDAIDEDVDIIITNPNDNSSDEEGYYEDEEGYETTPTEDEDQGYEDSW